MAVDRNELNKPPKATQDEIDGDLPLPPPVNVNKPRLSMGGGGLGMTIIVSAVIAFLVFTLIGFSGGGSFLTKKDFEANVAGMVETLNQAKAEVVVLQGTLDTAIAGLPNTVLTQINTVITSVNTKVSTLETNLATLQAKVTTLETSGATDASTILALQASLDTLKTEVASLTTKVNAYTTTTTTGGTTIGGDINLSLMASPISPIYSTGIYQYLLSVTNNSGVAKKVFIQTNATLTSVPSAPPNPNVTGTGTNFIAGSSTGWTGVTSFTTTFSPVLVADVSVGCFRISGISDGYLLMGAGTNILLPVTFNLVSTTTGAMWTVNFVPIATPF